MRRVVGVLVVASALASAAPARADNTSVQAAQAMFEEGRRLMASGQFTEACPKFVESQRLDPGAGTLLNLALCYEKSDRLASAWVTYTEAAEDADRSGRPEWVKRAKDKSTALAPHLTSITIVVPKNARADDLEVTRDGESVSAAGYGVKVPVDGGDHVVEAHAPGHEAWAHHVNAPARDANLTVTVPVLAVSTTPAPASEKKPKPSRGATQRTIGIIAGAVGIVGLGVGGFFTLRAASEHADAKKDCNAAETQCGPRGLSDYSSAKSSANVATIAVIAGGALLAGGVALFLAADVGRTAPANATAVVDGLARGWAF